MIAPHQAMTLAEALEILTMDLPCACVGPGPWPRCGCGQVVSEALQLKRAAHITVKLIQDAMRGGS